MADVRIRRTTVTVPASTGSQDITISGIGTPKAAILILSNVGVAGTARTDAAIAIGFTDGTTHRQGSIRSVDNLATTKGISWHGGGSGSGGRIIGQIAASAGSHDVLAAFTTWITDGIRINWTTTPTADMRLEVILFGGAAISNVACGYDSPTTTSAVTTLGWKPDLIFLMGYGRNVESPSSAEGQLSFGFSAGTTEMSVCWAEDSATTAATASIYSGAFGMQELDPGTGTRTFGASILPSTNGITHATSAGGNPFNYLAIKFNTTVGVSIFLETTPTTTGSLSKTGLSFKPGFGVMLGGCISAAANSVDTADSDGFTIGVFDQWGASAITHTVDDGAATSDTLSYQSNSQCHREAGVASGALSDYSSSAFTSFNSDGWTTAVTVGTAVALKRICLAIEANGVVDLSSIDGLAQAQTLDSPGLTQHAVLAPAPLTQLQTEDQPSYFIEHNVLAPAGMAQVQTLALPTLVQHSLLSPAGLAQIQTLDLPALLQHSLLSPAGVAQLQTLDLPTLLQRSLLSPAALAQLQELSQPSIAATVPLFVDGLAQLQTLGVQSMVLYNALPPDGLMQAQTFGEATMLVYGGVSAYALMQAQLINEPELLQQNILVVQNMAQAQVLDAVALVEHNLLAPADLAQWQTLSEPALISHAILVVNALSQLQTLSAASLLQHAVVTPTGLAHLVTLSEPALVQIRKVSPLGLVHVQTLAQPILIQPIMGAALAHLHEMSAPTLLQHSVLVADVLQQAQQLMEPILRPFFSVTPHGMTQGQTSSHVYIRYVINTMLEGVLRAYAQLDGTLVAEAALEAQLSATASLFGALKSLPVQ